MAVVNAPHPRVILPHHYRLWFTANGNQPTTTCGVPLAIAVELAVVESPHPRVATDPPCGKPHTNLPLGCVKTCAAAKNFTHLAVVTITLARAIPITWCCELFMRLIGRLKRKCLKMHKAACLARNWLSALVPQAAATGCKPPIGDRP